MRPPRFGAQSLPKRSRKSDSKKKITLEQSVSDGYNIGIQNQPHDLDSIRHLIRCLFTSDSFLITHETHAVGFTAAHAGTPAPPHLRDLRLRARRRRRLSRGGNPRRGSEPRPPDRVIAGTDCGIGRRRPGRLRAAQGGSGRLRAAQGGSRVVGPLAGKMPGLASTSSWYYHSTGSGRQAKCRPGTMGAAAVPSVPPPGAARGPRIGSPSTGG